MFKSLIIGVLMIASLGACAVIPPERGIPSPVIEWAETNVWKLDINGRKTGSAWWLNENYAVTACHVVIGKPKGQKITLRDNFTQFEEEFSVVTCSEDFDMAILLRRSFNTEFKPDLTIVADTDPRIGGEVYASGYPSQFNLLHHKGIWLGADISDFDRNTGHNSMTSGTFTSQGDSGSPVLDYKNGQVRIVGMRLFIPVEHHGNQFGHTGSHSVHYLTGIISGPIILTELETYEENLHANTP